MDSDNDDEAAMTDEMAMTISRSVVRIGEISFLEPRIAYLTYLNQDVIL